MLFISGPQQRRQFTRMSFWNAEQPEFLMIYSARLHQRELRGVLCAHLVSRAVALSFKSAECTDHSLNNQRKTNRNKQRCCVFCSGGLSGRLVSEVLLMPRNYSGAEVATVHGLLFMLLYHRCCSNYKSCLEHQDLQRQD